jgi:hypothetical protein
MFMSVEKSITEQAKSSDATGPITAEQIGSIWLGFCHPDIAKKVGRFAAQSAPV